MGLYNRLHGGGCPDSITHRIRSLTLVISALSVLFALLIFVVIDTFHFRDTTQRNSLLLAEITAYNSIGALSFSDNDAGISVLSSLQANSDIQFSGLYRADGKLFVQLGSSPFMSAQIESGTAAYAEYKGDMLEVLQPVLFEGDSLGYLLIIISTQEQTDRLMRYLVIIPMIMVVCGLLITILSQTLPRRLIAVLREIVDVIEDVAKNKDFSKRAALTHVSEFNVLVHGFNTMLGEISQRDQKLLRSEERLSLALEGSGEGLWDWDLQSETAFYDKRAHEILGYKMGAIGRNFDAWEALIHEDDRSTVRRNLRSHLSGQSSEYEIECRMRSCSGPYIWVAVHGKVVELSEEKKPLRLTGTLLNISDRHRAKEEIRVLSAVFKNSHEPVVVFDSDLYVQAMNSAFVELTRRDDDFLLGCNLSLLFSNHQDGEYFSQVRQALQHRQTWEGEIRCENEQQSELTIRWLSIAAISVESGSKNSTYLGTFSDVVQRQKVEDKLRYLANYDSLTGLPNRRLYNDRIQHALDLAKRYDRSFAVMFFDLDRFKKINDSLGHSCGDELLVQVAERLRGATRNSDTLARFGGDEFTLLLEEVNCKESVAKLALKLLSQFSRPFDISGHEISASCSIGISIYPEDGDDAETLMKNSDTAMYAAKSEGRNAFQFYQPSMNERATERLALESDLHKALERNEFFLVYQPKVSLATGDTIGAEVLLRWDHPSLGLVAPDQFISLAEESGLIVPIGRWVLKTACEKMMEWRELKYPEIKLAVNVSVRQFASLDFPIEVASILSATGLAAEYLELEVTESLLMDTADCAVSTLTRLKELGITLSIDDFGTGYSSLQYLSKFPIDLLKIDRSFVIGLDSGGKSVTIVRAIIAMAKGLDLKVIAEGIEDEGQARLLQQFDCDYAQGYFYSRPLKEPEFLRYLGVPAMVEEVS